jgi:hypothetical protein
MPRLARVKMKKGGAFYHVYCRTAGIKGEFLLDNKLCRRKLVDGTTRSKDLKGDLRFKGDTTLRPKGRPKGDLKGTLLFILLLFILQTHEAIMRDHARTFWGLRRGVTP